MLLEITGICCTTKGFEVKWVGTLIKESYYSDLNMADRFGI
jgi:hypothetical protein